jgi:hypothetical protein
MAASVRFPLGMLMITPMLGGATTGVVSVNHTSRRGATLPHVGVAGTNVVPVVGVAFWVVPLIVVQAGSTMIAVAEHGWSFVGTTGS